MKPFTAWIALSAQRLPAYFLGIHPTRSALKEHYSRTYAADLQVAGYTPMKVRVSQFDINCSRQEKSDG